MKRVFSSAMAAFLVALCLPHYSQAQITGGTVTGVIHNQQKEAVSGAKVTVTNIGTNQTHTTTSDAEGGFRLPALTAASYEITVEMEGYTKTVQQLTLRVNENARADFELSVAGTAETVNIVGASGSITETHNSVLGIVIENKQISELPLNGRNFLQLGTLVANVSSTASLKGGAEGGMMNGPFAVSGQRDRALTFLVDGVDNNNSLSNSLSAQVSLDAIQEFKMITNLGSAEFGTHSGGMLNIITKSGTNDFHASLFEFLRNNKLDAPNYFEKLADRKAGKFNNNQFGGTLAGRLVQDRTFFLANYEGQRLRASNTQFATVPTAAERQGIFFNPFLGRAVQLPVDPVATNILNRLVPLPNITSEFGNYFASATIRSQNDFGIIRVDHLLSGEDVLSGRYFVSNNTTYNPMIFNVVLFPSAPPAIPGFGLDEDSRTHNLALTYTHNFTVQSTNDLRFGYNRHFSNLNPEKNLSMSELGFRGVEADTGLFETFIPGITKLGNVFVYPMRYNMGNYHLADSVSLLFGRHSIKVGTELRWLRQAESSGRLGAGSLFFTGAFSRLNALADFVMGAPTLGFEYQRSFAASMRQTQIGTYVQDDFQVTPRLVLNLGLRYELSTVLSSPDKQFTNYTFSRGFYTPGVDGVKGVYAGDHNNFAPRLGFALSLNDSGRTVIRGGYGVYYDTMLHNFAIGLSSYRENQPLLSGSFGTGQPGRLGSVFEAASRIPLPPTIYTYDDRLRTPYAQHFNLTIQQEIGNNTVISGGYVGTKTTKLVRMRDVNAAVYIPGTDAKGQPISTVLNRVFRRPTQLHHLTQVPIDAIYQIENSASSIYHSFQATLTRRLSRNLSFLSAYTFAKSIDDATDPIGFSGDSGGPQNALDLRQERALSSFDIRQRLTLGYTYDLPFQGNRWSQGWQVNGLVTLQSGQPYTVVLGFDTSQTGSLNTRPNHVPGAFIEKDGKISFNPALPKDPATGIPKALIPATGQFGTLGRNTFTGHGYQNLDWSLIKTTSFGERLKVQARFEVFNVFNTVNLALPVRKLSEPLFGRSTKTQDVAGGVPGIGGGGPRVVQFALKLLY